MRLPEVVKNITEFIPTINYWVTKTDDPVSLFETTIRYLGGMLAGEHILKKMKLHGTYFVDRI
jgi:mannosyl-oligosaccharide alpha-1,2-mannosidase